MRESIFCSACILRCRRKESSGSSSDEFLVNRSRSDFTARSSATAEIARVSGHYADRGHSRSLILDLVSIESPYATCY